MICVCVRVCVCFCDKWIKQYTGYLRVFALSAFADSVTFVAENFAQSVRRLSLTFPEGNVFRTQLLQV